MNKTKVRLHKYLADWLKDQNLDSYTNPEIKRNIDSYGVLINGILIKNQLEWITPSVDELALEGWPVRAQVDFDKIVILFETKDVLVIQKPIGMPVESGAGYLSQNLLSWLNSGGLNIFDRSKTWDTKTKFEVIEGEQFFLAHRIDKDTQGVMIIAKNKTTLDFLQDQFRTHTVSKKYIALVEGLVDQNYIINNWQSRDRLNPIKQKFFWTQSEAVAYDKDVRNAKSIIKPIGICGELNQSIIQVEIKTGRMHQIRLQCENLGFALVADKVYNKKISFDKVTFNSNDENKIFIPLKTVQTLTQHDFETLKTKLFGDAKYCLLANELEIELPDTRLARFVKYEVEEMV